MIKQTIVKSRRRRRNFFFMNFQDYLDNGYLCLQMTKLKQYWSFIWYSICWIFEVLYQCKSTSSLRYIALLETWLGNVAICTDTVKQFYFTNVLTNLFQITMKAFSGILLSYNALHNNWYIIVWYEQ